MKIRLFAAAWVLAMPLNAVQAEGDVTAGKAIFERICAECHYEDDFAGRTSNEILDRIKQMAAPGSGHKADLAELDEGEWADLAAFLASAK